MNERRNGVKILKIICNDLMKYLNRTKMLDSNMCCSEGDRLAMKLSLFWVRLSR